MSDSVTDKNDSELIEFTPDRLRSWLENAAWRTIYGISDDQISQLTRYAGLVVETNKHMNLTAITDVQGIAERHILDSLTALPILDAEIKRAGLTDRAFRVADVGTGAGLPAVILKIMRPEIELYMIDSLAKRVRFLETVSAELHFERVSCLHLRAEEAGRLSELREQIDFVTARAVAELRILAEYCLPLTRPDGLFLAMKARADEELDLAKPAIKLLAAKTEAVDVLTLPNTDMERQLISIRKTGTTSKVYPRAAGKLQKKPL